MNIRNLIFLITIVFLNVGCGSFSSVPTSVAKKPKFDVVWTKSTLKQPYLGFRKLHTMTPVIWRDSVITGNAIDGLVSIERATGKLIWRRNFDGGVGVGLTIVKDTIYVGAGDSHFYAISAETGSIKWKFPIRSEGIGAPLVHQERVYFIAGNHVLYALKATDGQKLWTYNRQIRSNATIYGASKPAVRGDKLFVGFSDGHLVSLQINNGSVVWDQTLKGDGRFKDIDTTPIVIYGRIYAASFDGALFSLDLNGNILWRSEGGGANNILVKAKNIYYSTTDAKVIALDRKSGKLLWSKDSLKGYGTSPIFTKNLLVLGQTEGDILALNPDTGETISSYSTGRGTSSSVAIDKDQQMYINTVNANLIAFKLDWVPAGKEWPWSE